MSTLGPPPASIRADLEAHGFKPKELEGVEFWSNGSTTGTWAEAVHLISQVALTSKQMDALNPKAWWRSTKFWAFVGLGAGAAGTGATILAGWVAPSHPELGALLMSAGTGLGGFYMWIRKDENAKALAEKAKLLADAVEKT